MKDKLVIVESPAKARTLGKILGKGYNLKASLGHIRDLPRYRIGVDTEHGFSPQYEIPKDKKKLVSELKEAVAGSSAVFMATDPDREGEAISWHLSEVVKGEEKIPYRRVVFHEITEEAIKAAFKHPRELNMQLVNAQQARRIVDRLVGYKISPLLWKKVKRGLSAGRVQSVAVRIVVDREREILAFVAVEYWRLEAHLGKLNETGNKAGFKAALATKADGTKVALNNEAEALKLKTELEKAEYKVSKITRKSVNKSPAPPFITSSLQQEAWRQLRFSASRTMVLAQQLYEGLALGSEGSIGLITYMRTDSTHIASSALAETRDFIKEKYGEKYLPVKPRVFTKAVKGAQEAHEAIRPTRIHRTPESVKPFLDAAQYKLYDLIWKRMVASQMANAVYDNIAVDIDAKCAGRAGTYIFRTSSSKLNFPGFTALYIEGKDENGNEDEKERLLPELEKNEKLKLLNMTAEQNFTSPPPRYTEATLIKVLEQQGIGRPSTYAPILTTIQDREYVTKEKGIFKPTELGFKVNDLLVQAFPELLNIEFTAKMELELDEVASHNKEWINVVTEFYKPMLANLEKAQLNVEKVKLAEEITDEKCPNCGKPMAVKSGRFGKFLACTGYPDCKTTRPFTVKTGAKCPECGKDLVQRVSKNKKRFYGCSGYPDCKFAVFQQPVPQPCQKCGGLMLTSGKKAIKCFKCGQIEKVDETEKKAESNPETTAPAKK
ncbi:MAG TPA: type I DNA topoisomerase [Dehalococcoidales bacterium]|nr:type I DNA topoisomerase [Dehalococcoidales bacterium]